MPTLDELRTLHAKAAKSALRLYDWKIGKDGKQAYNVYTHEEVLRWLAQAESNSHT